MQHANPIMVGRNTPVETGTPTLNPLQAQLQAQSAPQAAPVAEAVAAPVAAQAPAPVAPVAQEQSVQQAGGCQLYFNIKPITKIEVEMPWAFISNKFDCVFVSNLGELVVCDLPPMYDKAHDVFVLAPETESLVLGKVGTEYMQYWRESVSFRPDSGYSEEDVKEVDTTEKKEEVIEEPMKPVLEDNVDYSHLSRRQRKNIKHKKLQAGANLEDLPKALRDA